MSPRRALRVLPALAVALGLLCLPSYAAASADWAIESTPNEGTESNALASVSCGTKTDCMAVGSYIKSGTSRTLTENWNGSSWSTQTPGFFATKFVSALNSVSCVPGSGECFAVGYISEGGVKKTMAWFGEGGSWVSWLTTPNVGKGDNVLTGVSCASASDCYAVGYYLNGGASHPLLEHWDGSEWTADSSWAKETGAFNSVACEMENEFESACHAVGYILEGGVKKALAYRSAAGSWWEVKAANQGTGDNVLTGVSCNSENDCTAVGHYQKTGVEHALTEHLDETETWTITVLSFWAKFQSSLNSVSCELGGTQCAVVGYLKEGSPKTNMALLSEGSEGFAEWTTENVGTYDNTLSGVSCSALSTNSCTAVGLSTTGGGVTKTLAERLQ